MRHSCRILASRDPTDVCVEEACRQSAERERISEINSNVLRGVNLIVDFHSRHSLSAGDPGRLLGNACGSPLATLFPQESRTLRSNQLERF
ncbi:hypothetical protein KEH51_01655 [[Brevibacterium] frigoritolerans]|uniref:Uncharacterized protein n=1 Tax=Peribacillus frigoritolerans TaxID=450367 RepID=A0A941FFP1_9BACI|nr:hypothetical protein [Peribacillus frigoritolerans]